MRGSDVVKNQMIRDPINSIIKKGATFYFSLPLVEPSTHWYIHFYNDNYCTISPTAIKLCYF